MQTIVLRIPELAERPVIGSQCCAVPAAEAIKRALDSWAGVRSVVVDPHDGRVVVEVSHGRPTRADLVWSLRMLGVTSLEVV